MQYTLKEHENKTLVTDDHLEERANITGTIDPKNVEVLNESVKDKKARKLIVKMEAIHVGKTSNSTFYTEEGLKGGLKSWTQPYNKPVLTHHNSHDGEAIGRILEAEYSDQTLSGKSGLIFTTEITDQDAMEKVLDGRYHTVSIGASTDKVTCNICGTNRTEEWCEHYPGKKYDDQSCHFIIGNTYGREISYVNTPSDENAGNISVQVAKTEDGNSNESINMQVFQMAEGLYQDADKPELNLYEHLNDDVRKMVDAIVGVTEGSESSMTDEEKKKKDESSDENETSEGKSDDKKSVDEKEKQSEGQKKKDESETEDTTTVEENDKNPELTESAFADLKEKVSKLQGSVSTLVLENQKLDSSLTTAEAENELLMQENAKLIEEAHLALAEKVTDLKISLNKADVISTDRDEAVQNHLKRTRESLTDTLTDLLSESKKKNMPEAGSVTNPGHSTTTDENTEKKMSMKEAEKALAKMFGFGKK